MDNFGYGRHRGRRGKGADAERDGFLQAVSWAYAEEVYDCHQTLMGRYQKEFMVKERFFRGGLR